MADVRGMIFSYILKRMRYVAFKEGNIYLEARHYYKGSCIIDEKKPDLIRSFCVWVNIDMLINIVTSSSCGNSDLASII